MRADEAASETLGTILLAGLTVLLAAAFGTVVFAELQTAPSAPSASFAVTAEPGVATINVTHAGGEALAASDVAFFVRLAEAGLGVTAAAGPDPWRPGGVWQLDLDDPLPASGTVVVTVTALAANELIGSSGRAFGAAAQALPAPSLSPVTLSPAQAMRGSVAAVTITANASHTFGLALVASVTVDTSSLGVGALTLVDDGTRGDRAAADGVFTGVFVLPANAAIGAHTLNVTARTDSASAATVATVFTVLDPGTDPNAPPIVSKATSGVSFGAIPSSANMTRLNVTNVTWDTTIPANLKNDVLIIKIGDGSGTTWSALVFFENHNGGALAVKRIDIYSATGGCSWDSPGGEPVTGPIDLLDPGSLGLNGPFSNSPTIPSALPGCTETSPGVWTGSYQEANVGDPAVLTIVRLGESNGDDTQTAVIHTDVNIA